MDGAEEPAGATPGEGKPEKRSRAPARRRRWVVVAVAAAIVVVAVVLGLASRPAGQGEASSPRGTPAADFVLDNLRPGQPSVSLAAFRGRPVVLNFFASWCVPCRREMPSFERVHRSVRPRVAFVGVNHQDQRESALDLLRETGVTYPAGFDPKGQVALDYGLFGMPTTIFISPQGQVLDRRTGEMTENELRDTIRRLFEG